MLNNLRAVLALQVALPLLLAFGLLIYGGLRVVETISEHRLQQEIKLVARVIREPVSEALNKGDLKQARDNVKAVFRLGRVYGAYLFDAHGRMLTAEGSVEPDRQQADRVPQIVAKGHHEGRYERISGRNVYSYFLPLFSQGGTPNGLLQITRKRSDFARQFAELRHRAWAVFGAISLLTLGGISLTHRRAIGRHVSNLLASMARVERGEIGHRAGDHGPEEIRRIAGGLNRMLDAMHVARMRSVHQRHRQFQMARRLREAERMAALGELSAGVAHELGAPLSVVDGRAQRIARRNTDPTVDRELTAIREQVSRMSSIVGQLLDFGRSGPGTDGRAGVADLIEQAVAEYSEPGRVDIGDIIDCELAGDPLRLRQALGNLVRNAVQSHPGAAVAVSSSCADDHVTITVDDDGPGVAEDIRTQIVAPFYTTKQPGAGSGLGLAIVSSVLREHDGILEIGDSPTGGARFAITLPIAHSSVEEPSS